MIKKVGLIVVVLGLVFVQVAFIYSLQNGGTSDYENLWRGFNISQSEYSKFVFSTIKWWWSLPVFSLCIVVLALRKTRELHTATALLAIIMGTVALYWSVYAPSMFIGG